MDEKKKSGFCISSLLNAETLDKKVSFERKKIEYDKLIPNPKNDTYSIENIDELADSIEDSGLLQNLVVKQIPGTDTYSIIVGHRRREAIRKIVEERGNEDFRMVDCYVIPKDEDELMTELKLHTSNLESRELSPFEKMSAVSELKRIYAELKASGKMNIKGRVRDIIANDMGLKTTQVQKYMSIDENATDETKEALKNGDITTEEAYKQVQIDSGRAVPGFMNEPDESKNDSSDDDSDSVDDGYFDDERDAVSDNPESYPYAKADTLRSDNTDDEEYFPENYTFETEDSSDMDATEILKWLMDNHKINFTLSGDNVFIK